MSTVLMRKNSFIMVGGFNVARFGTEDVDFWVRLAQKGRIIYSHLITANRYQSQSGTSYPDARWLNELVDYHQMCLESPDYSGLQDLVRSNLIKTYRNMLIFHGKQGSRLQVIKTYRKTLQFGFKPRVFLDMCFALMGYFPLSLLKKIQLAKIKVTSRHNNTNFPG